MRVKNLLFVVLLFAFVVAPACVPVYGNQSLEFSDTAGHWAAESIIECKLNGLISGYPGNVFKPGQSLSRVEALVLINRAMGWDSQLSGVSTSGISFPPDLWKNFRGHVALAAARQLISRNDIPNIKFNAPAPRVEVAVWLGRALNLKGNGAGLKFADINKIPSTSRDLVAGVVDAGIITGLPGNLFEPDKPLTRAEMASILARMMKDKKINSPTGKYLMGKLTSADWINKKISLQASSGSGTYPLAASYTVYRNGKIVTLDTIKAGEDVRITLDGSGGCIFIAYNGSTSASGQSTTSFTTTTASGDSLSYSGNRGYVVNKYWDYFSVRLSDGSVESCNIANVSFTGNATSYGAIQKGSFVELVRSGSKVTGVKVLSGSRKVFGEVKSISSQSINITDDDDRDLVYNLGKSVDIRDEDGDRADIEDVEQEMNVELTLGANNEVTAMKLGEDTGDLEGIVKDIKTSGTKKITIEDNDGDSHTYYLAVSVTVKEKGITKDIDDVDEGMDVELTLNSAKEVSKIEIKDATAVKGEVIYIKTSGTKKIEIEKSNGSEVSYNLLDSVTVKEDGRSRSLSYIDLGMDVELTLNSDNKVTRIEITGSTTSVKGEVTYIKTSGTKKIRIEKSNGSETTYYLADSVKVKKDGNTKSLSYIDEGMDVKLTLDDDDEVTRIDIL